MVLREFRLNVEKAINESKLPIDAIYYVLKDVMNEVTNIYSNEIQKENAEMVAQEAAAATKEEEK